MMELLDDLPDHVVGVRAIGEVDDHDAMWDDTKLGLKTFSSYDRMAVVTDATWVRRSVKAFGWLIPGEVRVFHTDGLATARTWITD
jgi:hypothetical protein